MNVNKTYRICLTLLIEKNSPGRRPLFLSKGIKEASHMFLQQGEEMRKQSPEHPSPVRDLRNVHESRFGRKKRKDTKGVVCTDSRLALYRQILGSTKLCN